MTTSSSSSAATAALLGADASDRRQSTTTTTTIDASGVDAYDDDADKDDDDDDDDDAEGVRVHHAAPAKVRACSCASRRCRTVASVAFLFAVLFMVVGGLGAYGLGLSFVARADSIVASGWTRAECRVIESHVVYANASHVQTVANESDLAAAGIAVDGATQLCTWTTLGLLDGDAAAPSAVPSACGVPAYIARHTTAGSGACLDVTETHRRPVPRVGERRACLWPVGVPTVSPRECTTSVLDTSVYLRLVHADQRRFVYTYEDAAEERAVVTAATYELRSFGILARTIGLVAMLLLCVFAGLLGLLCAAQSRAGSGRRAFFGKLARD
jgi:hypothetical protein